MAFDGSLTERQSDASTRMFLVDVKSFEHLGNQGVLGRRDHDTLAANGESLVRAGAFGSENTRS